MSGKNEGHIGTLRMMRAAEQRQLQAWEDGPARTRAVPKALCRQRIAALEVAIAQLEEEPVFTNH